MKHRTLITLALALFLGAVGSVQAQYEPAGCISEAEQELADLVNQYRADNGKSAVPLSQTLLLVGQWHVADHNYAEEVTGEWGGDPQCNLHTWYGIPDAPYTTCCYTPDHGQASCMWIKPSEISGGSYSGTGYEAAAMGYETVEDALEGWKNSPGHNDFILSNSFWQEWTAMGVGVDPETRRYFLWLSDVTDPVGVDPCAPSAVGELPGVSLVRHEASPNPFSSHTEISYQLARPGNVRAVILSAGGRIVRTLEEGSRPIGEHHLRWDGLDDNGVRSSNGLYFVRILAGGTVGTSKVVLLGR